jgi:nicotinate-nucleotide adenylyltransferase
MDTVEYLNRKYKTRIYLIIGDDLVKDFDKWNEPKKLSKIAQIVLARRHFEKPIEFAYEHISIKNPIVNGASSDVRKLVLTASCGWEKYLSAEVSDYIKLNGLYGYWQGVTKKVTAALKINVSEHRYEHSLRVAQMMDKLCKHYDLDREKGYFAGISHDLCKRMNEKDMLEIVSIDGMPLTEVEKEFPVLLHGRAAAVKLAKDFGIIHKDVLEAVAFHTFGKPHMSEIGMMLFVADKIEPERQQTNPEYYERLFSLSLNEMTLSVLEENIEYLHNKGKVASDLSLEMQKWLKKEIYDK